MLHRVLLPVACVVAFGACATTEATSRRMLDLNKQALTAFEEGELTRARELLLQAVKLGKQEGLTKHNSMARTYLDLGAVYLALNERDKGLRNLGLALRIEPDIQPSDQIATPPVKKALASARAELKRRRGNQAATEKKKEKADDEKPAEAAPLPPRREEPVAPPRAIVKASPAKAEPPAPRVVPAAKADPVKAPPPEPPAPVVAKAAPPPPPPEDEEPDLPANVPQPLYCPLPDAAPPNEEINLRCVTRPGMAVSKMSLFYRSAGSETFTQVAMVRSKKGWYQGLVPGTAVVGNSLQYYVEASAGSGKKATTTHNGQTDSPNLMSIRAGAAPVGQGTLAAARFARPKSHLEIKEDDPLLAAARARERREEVSADHRRRAGAIWLGAGIGSGWGWHPRRILEFRTGDAVAPGFSPGGLLQVTPEVGYQWKQDIALSLQGRFQFIPESGSGDTKMGHPKHGAWAILARGYRFYGDGNGQFFLTGTLGGGQGFRLVVPPHPEAGVLRNDTVRGGPVVLGPGAGYLHHFTRHFAWVAEARVLAGVPDLAAIVELSTGGQVGF